MPLKPFSTITKQVVVNHTHGEYIEIFYYNSITKKNFEIKETVSATYMMQMCPLNLKDKNIYIIHRK